MMKMIRQQVGGASNAALFATLQWFPMRLESAFNMFPLTLIVP